MMMTRFSFHFIVLLIFLLVWDVLALEREDLLDYLKYKQQTRTTFDGRIDQQVEPLGYVDGKPIWPRILEKVKSPGRIIYDDDNFAYLTNERSVVDLVHKMDMEENYKRVIAFLDRYTN